MRHRALPRSLILVVLGLVPSSAGCPDHDHGDHGDHGDHDEHDEHHDDERGADAPPGVVRIAPKAMSRNGIEIGVAEERALSGAVEAPAEVQLPPDRVAHVTPIVPGQLTAVRASIGARVQRGEALATLKSVELGEARSALADARAQAEVARTNFERQEKLVEEGIGARRELLEAKAALERANAELTSVRNRLNVYGSGGSGATTLIKSPIDGIVLERHATVGEVVDPNRTLFVVGDPREVWVVAQVYPQDVHRVSEGASAELRLRAVSERTFTGELSYVAPTMDSHTRTMPVRMVVDNEDGSLRPGLFGTLFIAPTERNGRTTVAIEAEAVIELDGRDVVFVPRGEPGAFRAAPVEVGARTGNLVEVRDGLSAGDRYVSRGAFVLKSELEKGQLGEGHHH